jgi:hypothetical protein
MRPVLLAFIVTLVLSSAAPSFGQCLLPGGYTSTPALSYTCAFGIVHFDIQRWDIAITGNVIKIDVFPGASGFGYPNPLTGTIDCQTGAFTATRVWPGTCTETYTLTGQVQSIGSWTGTFRAAFTGNCLDCSTQNYPVSGALPPTGVRPGSAPPLLARLEVGPNPLGASTTMRVHLDSRQDTRLVIRDVTGRAVATLVAGTSLEEGDYEYAWDGRTNEGRRVPSGIYFVQLRTNVAERVAKLVVLD